MKLSFILLASFAAAVSGAQTGPSPVLPTNAAPPQWASPSQPQVTAAAVNVRSKDLELTQTPNALGAFVIRVAGKTMAIGQNHPMLGYVLDGQLRWLDLSSAADRTFAVHKQANGIRATFECLDADGARWQIEQQLTPGSIPGAIHFNVEVGVDHDRAVAFLPMLMLFPGAGSFGTTKGQALFAGLEYLENEPSSSEADVIGPASKRQVPDDLKITFPLMAIQNDGCYLALVWQMRPYLAALFDSPDRFLGSGGHVMGLLFPGSDGKNRQEGSLLPRMSQLLHARQPVSLRATLLGGKGDSVVPALKQYVSLRGLPPLPAPSFDLAHYAPAAGGGWLNSKIREGALFHHAVAGGHFPLGHAADAGMWMDWLAAHTEQAELAQRLREAAKQVIAEVPPADLNAAGIGHVRYPAPALVYGDVAENAARTEQAGRAVLSVFEPDGSVIYHPRPGGPDFSKTHFSHEATGLTARSVVDLLEAAAFSGDSALIDAGLKRLRAMDKFRNGVPRGAQTWECPLHTPDILASALMVRAYTLGFQLSGDRAFLEQAQYWAWTGLPFVYLVSPTAHPVGLYATIAVFGATHWQAPVWLGLPVQWCGLVYADALYRLERVEPGGPWKKVADGITISGIQQTWPPSDTDLQGLLPDSFVLRTQHRNGPAINPATVEACAVRYFGQTPVYDFWSFQKNGVRVHAPGEIKNPTEQPGRVRFEVDTWLDKPYYVLVNGLTKKPQIKINGKLTECAPPHQLLEKEGRLILRMEGKPQVELGF